MPNFQYVIKDTAELRSSPRIDPINNNLIPFKLRKGHKVDVTDSSRQDFWLVKSVIDVKSKQVEMQAYMIPSDLSALPPAQPKPNSPLPKIGDKQLNFVRKFYPDALRSQTDNGLSAVAILAQAALESGWGQHAPGNMFFGVKDTDGINGNEQLLRTTEYSKRVDARFPRIISVEPVTRNGEKWFKYTIEDYFRKFDTPADSFIHHANFFILNKRYAKALTVRQDPYAFFKEIAKAGYATDPNYASMLTNIAKTIELAIEVVKQGG